jgi:hypothetical protein
MRARLTRKQLAAGGMICGHCYAEHGTVEHMEPRCAYDRAAAGDEAALEAVKHIGLVASARARGIRGARPQRHRTQRRCTNVGCGRFMPAGAHSCPSCSFDPATGYADALPF